MNKLAARMLSKEKLLLNQQSKNNNNNNNKLLHFCLIFLTVLYRIINKNNNYV